MEKSDPDLSQLYFIRGIMKRRFGYCNEIEAIILLKKARKEGYEIDDLKQMVLDSRNCLPGAIQWMNYSR
jgi:hypothetical protein